MTNSRTFNWTTQNNLEYDLTLGDNEHFINVLLSQRFQRINHYQTSHMERMFQQWD